MSRFEKYIEEYRRDILEEQPPADPAMEAPPPPAPAGGPPPPAGAEGEAPPPEEPSAEDVVDELEKESKKPWIDLAGILAKAMEYNWSDTDVNQINNDLPGPLTIQDFINVRESPNMKSKYDENIVSSAITFFDIIEKFMNKDNMGEVVPADER